MLRSRGRRIDRGDEQPGVLALAAVVSLVRKDRGRDVEGARITDRLQTAVLDLAVCATQDAPHFFGALGARRRVEADPPAESALARALVDQDRIGLGGDLPAATKHTQHVADERAAWGEPDEHVLECPALGGEVPGGVHDEAAVMPGGVPVGERLGLVHLHRVSIRGVLGGVNLWQLLDQQAGEGVADAPGRCRAIQQAQVLPEGRLVLGERLSVEEHLGTEPRVAIGIDGEDLVLNAVHRRPCPDLDDPGGHASGRPPPHMRYRLGEARPAPSRVVRASAPTRERGSSDGAVRPRLRRRLRARPVGRRAWTVRRRAGRVVRWPRAVGGRAGGVVGLGHGAPLSLESMRIQRTRRRTTAM